MLSLQNWKLAPKIVVGICVVSAITYGTTAFFIFVLQPRITMIPFAWFVLITLLLGLFWTGLLGWLAARSLIRPLISLSVAAEQASSGQLQVNIPQSTSRDEIGVLISSFQQMMDNLRSMIAHIANSSDQTDQHTTDLTDAIKQAAEQIDAISRTTEQIAEYAHAQSNSTQKISHNIEQVTTAIHHMDQLALETKQISSDLSQSVQENSRTVVSIVEGLQQVSASGRQAADAVRDLENLVVQIGDISNLVGDLSAQTHLLALNASIEAARAGEAGRGFAVVAQSVKSLADESADSVEKIQTLIEKIQSETSRTANYIGEQAELAKNKSDMGGAAITAMESIHSHVNKVAESVETITGYISSQVEHARSTSDEAAQVAETAAHIGDLAGQVFASTEEHNAAMQEVTASSTILNDHARRLKAEVDKFKW